MLEHDGCEYHDPAAKWITPVEPADTLDTD
jgi:hypothetical protein